jgi:hypothetical protein
MAQAGGRGEREGGGEAWMRTQGRQAAGCPVQQEYGWRGMVDWSGQECGSRFSSTTRHRKSVWSVDTGPIQLYTCQWSGSELRSWSPPPPRRRVERKCGIDTCTVQYVHHVRVYDDMTACIGWLIAG